MDGASFMGHGSCLVAATAATATIGARPPSFISSAICEAAPTTPAAVVLMWSASRHVDADRHMLSFRCSSCGWIQS